MTDVETQPGALRPGPGQPAEVHPARAQPRRRGETVRTLVRGLGQTLITLGLVVLLFCVYELYVTDLFAGRDQQALAEELDRRWSEPIADQPGAQPADPLVAAEPSLPGEPAAGPEQEVVPAALGQALARMYLPTVDDQARTVVEGVSVSDLKRGGPGHIPGTAQPGAVGNAVFSGHRTTYGRTFANVDQLSPGDPIVVETRDTWWTYRVTGTQIVRPDAIEVTYPVPGRAGVAPTEAVLTLTTCHPRYSAQQRMIVSAELEGGVPKADGLPPALAG